MAYDQKVETVNLYAKADPQKRIDQQAALGWEVVSTTLNRTIQGEVAVITFRRDRQLKLYPRFVDLGNKVDFIRKTSLEHAQRAFAQSKTEFRHIILKTLFNVVLIVGLLFADVMYAILWFRIVKTDTLTLNALTNMFFWFVLIFIGHAIQSSLSRKLKRFEDTKPEEAFYKQMDGQIENLVREAAKLDHSILIAEIKN